MLLDFVLQDGNLGPTGNGMGSDPPAEADALFWDTKPMAPEGMALSEGASENGILGNAFPFTLHHATSGHFYVLVSLNYANQSRIILVMNNSRICAAGQALLTGN